ncbi:MAG: 8-amino-7-oxononanoate synthase [Planctomycetota bacterium]|jgi:8-amino-7-oxononanoate synthase
MRRNRRVSEPVELTSGPEPEVFSKASSWDSALRQRLEQARAEGLDRNTDRVRSGIDFVSNDYLGFADHPRLVEAARAAAHRFGVGARAARLLGGGCELDAKLESSCARWLGAETALLFPSGYQANVGLLPALAQAPDLILSDELNHASLIDGMRLSRATVQRFPHVDLEALESRLHAGQSARMRFVVTESVFSMDGDLAPLAEIAKLCRQYDAWMIVDEAHAIGLLSEHGAGAWCALRESTADIDERVVARIVTGGKSLGASGALVACDHSLRAWMLQSARSFLFTTAPPPTTAASLLAAIELCRESDDRRQRTLASARRLANTLNLPQPGAAIVPIHIGTNERVMRIASELQSEGYEVGAVRPPTVPEGTARLRVVCHANNTETEIEGLTRALGAVRVEGEPDLLRDQVENFGRREAELRDVILPANRKERQRGQAPSPARHSDSTEFEAISNSFTGTELPSSSAHQKWSSSSCLSASVNVILGTDTDVGKTVASALLLRAAALEGPAAYWKPVQTGSDCDTEEVCRLAAGSKAMFFDAGQHFQLPASPHEAAAAEGRQLDVADLDGKLLTYASDERIRGGQLIVEMAGGLLVPWTNEFTGADWIERHRPHLTLVARSGLGTLNHTLLTVEALRTRGLRIGRLLLVGAAHASNTSTLARALDVEPILIPHFDQLGPEDLAQWLTAHPIPPCLRPA